MATDIYISSPSESVLDEVRRRCAGIKLCVLLTMARMTPNIEAFLARYGSIIQKLALDCGAFSLNNSNLGLTSEQLFARLIGFAKANGHRFELMFSYDGHFGPDSFEDNQAYLLELEEHGLPVVPVIHNLTNHEVDTFIRGGYEYVAIGQCKHRTRPEVLFPAVYKLHDHGVKVHLFGITNYDLLVGCPAASCDSKSWLDDAKTGVVRFWNPAKATDNKTDLIYFPDIQGKTKAGTHVYHNYKDLDVFTQYIGGFGLTLEDLLGLRAVTYREFLGILYYKTLETVIAEKHAQNPLFV